MRCTHPQPARGVGEVGLSDHMRDYMAGFISAEEYVRRTRRDVAVVVRRELRARRGRQQRPDAEPGLSAADGGEARRPSARRGLLGWLRGSR